ncbi:hypothetical protein AW27_030950 [Streptomyces sp. PCS3-D2]|uniref:hypothetical protein n=1 Tax=Streptomyces sp. PCS3-D2 TaxID=1460244 RepID=UPI00044A43D2|nr:hypothetical protein [Streptomyces sp. PCS3-D2]WKV75555.1 hypothetical protein AW27_030950 [Streptomyces sp. PCS3-D2]
MSGNPAGRHSAQTRGDNSPAIGFVGKLFLSVLVGDVVEFADRAKRWGGWNWPPFLLVVMLDGYALISAPAGPPHQFLSVYLAIAGSLVLALARLAHPRSDSPARHWRVLISAAAVMLAVAATVGMDHLSDHGEKDVTGRTSLTPPGEVTPGSELTLVVAGPTDRAHLRLKLTISDAHPDRGFCDPETHYAAQLRDRAATRVKEMRSGRTADFPLGGLQGRIEVQITLWAEEGCRMNVSVAEAVLHD